MNSREGVFLAEFGISAYSISIGEFGTVLNFGDFGARFSISNPISVKISDDDGFINLTELGMTNFTIGDDDQGPIRDITYRMIAVDGEIFAVAIVERAAVADYLVIPIDSRVSSISDTGLPNSGGYSVGDETDLFDCLYTSDSAEPNSSLVGVDDAYSADEDNTLNVAATGRRGPLDRQLDYRTVVAIPEVRMRLSEIVGNRCASSCSDRHQ